MAHATRRWSEPACWLKPCHPALGLWLLGRTSFLCLCLFSCRNASSFLHPQATVRLTGTNTKFADWSLTYTKTKKKTRIIRQLEGSCKKMRKREEIVDRVIITEDRERMHFRAQVEVSVWGKRTAAFCRNKGWEEAASCYL